MARTDPIGFCYKLEGDGRQYFIKDAVFPTTTSLVIGVSSAVDDQFVTKIGSGLAPFQHGVLTLLDSSLSAVSSYGWDNTTLTRVDFPAMDARLNGLVTFTVTLGVVNVQPVTQDSSSASGNSGGGSSANRVASKFSNFHLKAMQDAKMIRSTSAPSGHRKDPYVNFAFRLKIDGIGDNAFITRIDPFSVGQGASNTFVVTCSESVATPFRTWFQTGGKRGGQIEYLSPSLTPCFRMDFTGLSIASVYPAFPGTVPAMITFAFDSVIFYPVS